jgi:hypothetical protein
MKKLATLIFLFVSFWAIAQNDVRPAALVDAAKASNAEFAEYTLFQEARNQNTPREVDFKDYELLQLQPTLLKRLLREQPAQLTMSLPAEFMGGEVQVELVRVNLFGPGFNVITASNGQAADVELGLHYRGIVKGNSRSIAALSFFEGDVMGLISSPQNGNLVLGALEGEEAQSKRFILYADKAIQDAYSFECGTDDIGKPYTQEEISDPIQTRSLDDCVGLYYEVDYDIFLDKGGLQNTTNYVTGIFNQVALLYANEGINTFVSDLVIWDTNSPFSSFSSSGMLDDFQAWHNNNSWVGTFGQLLSYQASGGVASTIDGMCVNNRDFALCFSSIASFYANVPTYSWTVQVLTHEFGHLFGSRHTHACVWNGNGTAIDGCSGFTEGSCSTPGIPSNGGTIMSYCHQTSVGISFLNGFGVQPGNVIRNVVDNANCLFPCTPACDDGIQNGNETDVDCGGPDCPACPTCFDGIENGDELAVDCGGPDCPACPCTENLQLTITLDNYPGETTWEVVDADGDVWAEGGPYSGFSPGTQIVEDICLPQGCYDFIMYDAYGDGICCSYGQGSYQLVDTQSGAVYASGGQFGSSETTPFCAVGPSCNDGIQNGSETGVDCGGPDCDPCPCLENGMTLTIDFDAFPQQVTWDLVSSNGQVVAAGGPYDNSMSGEILVETLCVPGGCYDFTIYDGGNNGLCCRFGQGSYQLVEDATGTMLAQGANYTASATTQVCFSGGPPPPTCNDGIQNGDEEGVDCGGSNCPPCQVSPTCNDGIQNGDEEGVDCGGSNCPPCQATPTCNDGIQNGDEEGIDCGGSNCAPCATCNDGIQNGDETGVDCGGPDCPACPTCNDGIQNGNETDVDCGGPDCPACPTCDDGIQNGDETDVDCGGPDCPACPTCNDGIQNGDEEDVDCGGSDCPACPTCTDGVQNGDEEGVDCGGSECAPCASCDDGVQNGSETGVDCGGPACVPCGTGCDVNVDLLIQLDGFPQQTTWEIVDVAGNVYGSGGPYASSQRYEEVTESVCLPAGCFSFVIYDSGNNGICCRFGQGFYELTDDVGNMLASGGEFDAQESSFFCVGGGLPATGLSAPASSDLRLFPNPTKGQVTLVLDKEVPAATPLRIFNLMGEEVFRTQLRQGERTRVLQMDAYPSGVYMVEVRVDGEVMSKRLVVTE